MEKDILLAAVPLFVGAVVAHLWPSRKELIVAFVAIAVIGVCLGRLYRPPAETLAAALGGCFLFVAVGSWTIVALLYRARAAQRMGEVVLDAATAKAMVDALQKDVRDTVEIQNELLGRMAKYDKAEPDGIAALRKEVKAIADGQREDIARMDRADGAMKDFDQRFADAFREMREIGPEIKGSELAKNEQGHVRRIVVAHPTIAALNEAIEASDSKVQKLTELTSKVLAQLRPR